MNIEYWPCWSYFDRILKSPRWEHLRVLDFGGSWGHLLGDPACKLPEENYWAIDVRKEPVAHGKVHFPRAHWFHYNRWNPQYNPSGEKSEKLPDFSVKFDLILARSVFTHILKKEMLATVENELVPLLADDGMCAITFFPTEKLAYHLGKYSSLNPDQQALLELQSKAFNGGFYLISGSTIYDADCDLELPNYVSLTTFYPPQQMVNIWPKFDVKVQPDEDGGQWVLFIRNPSNETSANSDKG